MFIALGFSLGDELGFPDSLGNVEGSKKRSLDIRSGGNAIGVLPASQMSVRCLQWELQIVSTINFPSLTLSQSRLSWLLITFITLMAADFFWLFSLLHSLRITPYVTLL